MLRGESLSSHPLRYLVHDIPHQVSTLAAATYRHAHESHFSPPVERRGCYPLLGRSCSAEPTFMRVWWFASEASQGQVI